MIHILKYLFSECFLESFLWIIEFISINSNITTWLINFFLLFYSTFKNHLDFYRNDLLQLLVKNCQIYRFYMASFFDSIRNRYVLISSLWSSSLLIAFQRKTICFVDFIFNYTKNSIIFVLEQKLLLVYDFFILLFFNFNFKPINIMAVHLAFNYQLHFCLIFYFYGIMH